MCGVCGFVNFKRPPLGDKRVLKRMTDALTHRGPDAEGFLEESHISLGHRRLKVIDLEGGQQPMTSQDGRVTLAFNGEIYNFRELRQSLEKQGHSFKTRSDTESFLIAYQAKGIACLKDLRGMFACSIWDRKLNKLFLAVDAFGKKPLFWSQVGSELIFASEIRSLLKHPSVSKSIDERALAQYLAFEYVPAPRTMIQGISKLSAGTVAEFSPQGMKLESYHNFKPSRLTHNGDRGAHSILESLKDATRARLVSDVPLGVFLSGGIDSSAIVALIRELEPARKIKTFTIGFDEASFDESSHAQTVSDRFQTDHVTETCSVKQMLTEHQSILRNLDEPLADPSFIPTFILCRLARKHVTVVLSGDGGDELFMGYPTFRAECLAQNLARWPQGFLKVVSSLVSHLPVSTKNLSPDFLLKQFFKGYFYPEAVRRQVWLSAFSELEASKVLMPGVQSKSESCWQILTETAPRVDDYLERSRDFYFQYYLQGDILVKTDRASMANSLEVRSPILDDDFVQSVRSIPARDHFRKYELKHLFKKSLRGKLPASILARNKKGFGIPISKWIREDLKGEFESTFRKSKLDQQGLFRSDEVQAILKEHLSGKRDNRKRLWTLYVFQKWFENCL